MFLPFVDSLIRCHEVYAFSQIDFKNRRCIRQHQTHMVDETKDKGAELNFERSDQVRILWLVDGGLA